MAASRKYWSKKAGPYPSRCLGTNYIIKLGTPALKSKLGTCFLRTRLRHIPRTRYDLGNRNMKGYPKAMV